METFDRLIKIWIVFQNPDGELDAVKVDPNNNLQCLDLINKGNQIVGFPTQKRKNDAIEHIREVINAK
jgi:hypothetical protein